MDETALEHWLATNPPDLEGVSHKEAGVHYSRIFERRFRNDREAGYAALETAMEGKQPSLGYSLLAEIIQHTRHKIVITTNFDNLVADALAMHAHQSPLVVAHESLAGFVRPQLRRPLVAKIHRDLFFSPKNDINGVSTMEESWSQALKKVFQYFTPIVVGYGGNDGSLMGMLNNLMPGDIPGRMIWCCRAGSTLPETAEEVLKKHNGIRTDIPGFDEFMLQLAAKLVPDFDIAELANRTAKLGEERAKQYREQADKLQGSLKAKGKSASTARTVKALTPAIKKNSDWWSWLLRARAEADPDRREAVYREALINLPNNTEILGSYALFLADERKDLDAAEAMYKKALELEPASASNAGSYARFLADGRKDLDAAEAMFKKALELDPSDAFQTGNYANFLADERKDLDAAEAMFKKALELDPSDAFHTGNYAIFLAQERKDFDAAEALFKKALELDPSDASQTGNYALFLDRERKNFDAAETMFKKALELDPSIAAHTANYAIFLAQERKDFDAAEAMFKKALELDPSAASITCNYANFLANERKDFDAAEAMFKKALELDPSAASITGNYANFLAEVRKDLDAAEAMFKRALELDPFDAFHTGNYALFLALERKDFDAAETMFKKALELDPSIAAHTANYASFLADERKDFDAAEAMFKKALELDPSDAFHAGNYANFLAEVRKDFDAAEAVYKKAVERDPIDVNDLANFAALLLSRRDVPSLEKVNELIKRCVAASDAAPSQALAEALLYGALSNELRADSSVGDSLSRLKGLLTMGFERGSWDFSRVFEATLPNISEDKRSIYRAVGAAILDANALVQLKDLPAWQEVTLKDPFAY